MVMGSLDRLAELVDDGLRRRVAGVAHAEIDDVFTGAAGGELEFVHDGEHVRGEAVDACEVGGCPAFSKPQLLAASVPRDHGVRRTKFLQRQVRRGAVGILADFDPVPRRLARRLERVEVGAVPLFRQFLDEALGALRGEKACDLDAICCHH